MRRITLLIALFAFIAGCSPAEPAPEEIDITGEWQLVSGVVSDRAIPLIDGSPVTLSATGTEIRGRSACNSYGGRFLLDGSSISIGDLTTTIMACSPEVMAVEVPYYAALSEVDTVAFDGGQLVMTGPGIEFWFTKTG